MKRQRILFGASRYALERVWTRWNVWEYCVTDAETVDYVTGLPGVIGQAETACGALESVPVPRVEKVRAIAALNARIDAALARRAHKAAMRRETTEP